MKTYVKVLILILILSTGTISSANKMDSETQHLVIDRLEQIIANMKNSDSSWVASNIRLADLLAERARLRFMTEIEQACKDCKGSGEDREKALRIYSMVISKTKGEQKGVILFQMAHLHEMNNSIARAIDIYSGILNSKSESYSAEIITRSRVSLADLYFQKGQFKQAKELYQAALKDSLLSQKGVALYRLSWCEFNLGNFNVATELLESLAGNKSLLVSEGSQGVVEDPGFRNDVLHDLVTFYSQNSVSENQIKKFLSLLPADHRKELILLFAQETSRLGQKQASANLYKLYLGEKDLTKEESLNASLALVQTSYEQGQANEAIRVFAETAKVCSAENKCKELQKQMRHFVTELHKLKISKPDQDLLKAYEVYAQSFPSDVEMAVLGAQVATDINQSAKANQFYTVAAENAENPKLRKMALLGEVEAAEHSHDSDLRAKSYNHYLKLMPKDEKSYEMRYQLAMLSYEKKNWPEAAAQFRTLALEKTSQKDLQKKSADLSLDCLALGQKDQDIEVWAMTYAKALPKFEMEFRKIYRTAINTQVVKTANNDKASVNDIKLAIQKNLNADLKGASEQEKILHFNNLTVLAKKINDNETLMNSYSSLLAMKTLPASERESVMAAQVGLYEKKLDFKNAYIIALKMRFPALKTFEKELRLGTLADLANLKPQAHYQKALQTGLHGSAEISVRQRLVLLSATPAKELKKQTSKMLLSPKIIAETALLIFAQDRNEKELNFVLYNSRLANQPAIRFIKKQYFYPQQTKLAAKVAVHKLDNSSDQKLASSIKIRLKLLMQADAALAEALKLKDFTAELMALSLVSKENLRLNQELLNTPRPQGLTPKEQTRYLAMLKKSSAPYMKKALLAQEKSRILWSQKSDWQAIIRDYANARAEVQTLLAQEIRILIDLAPNAQMQSLFEDSLRASQASRSDLISARGSVSQEPNNIPQIEKLINLETKLGHPLMATYLEERLGQIQKGTRL